LLALALLVVIAVAVGLATAAGDAARAPAAPRPKPASAPQALTFDRLPDLVARAQPQVVTILARGPAGEGQGSGVIWDREGTIVTNAHVVAGATRISVALASGDRLAAKLRASDPLSDVAVLTVGRRGLPAATFATKLPRPGELALAIGSPLGLENTVTAGIVSGLHRSVPSGGQTPALVDLIQTDAPISPGNSGGALVNGKGLVIGLNVAYIPPEARAVSIGFAIPAQTVSSVVKQLLASGTVRHAFLGITPAPLTPALAQQFGLTRSEGVLVLDVVPNSGAARAGIRPGDLLVAIERRPVRTVEDLYAELRKHTSGERIDLKIANAQNERHVTVTLSERPPA
jgi:S1-C subfamily serine protease